MIQLLCLIVLFQLSLTNAAQERVVCYWANWNTGGAFKHTPEDIDPTLCTHLHYAFAILDETNLAPKDSNGQPEVDIYKRLNALKQKNKNLKLILSIGGWGDNAGKYSKLTANAANRKKFNDNAVAFLHKYGFDGLDIDWEFPVCWQAECNAAHNADKHNFGLWTQELRTEFDKQNPKLSLSAAVSGGSDTEDQAYDYNALGKNLDYINVMTYDGAGEWDGVTGHHSGFEWSKSAVQHWSSKGVPKDKILVGVPFYGHTFTLKSASNHKIGAPINGVGKKMPSGEDGNAYYVEICDLIKHQGWTKEQSSNGHDPIAYHGDQWVGYDDPNQAFQISKWAKDNGYGGVLIWEISQDDVHKKCCSVSYPLLRAINHGLFGTGGDVTTYGCE